MSRSLATTLLLVGCTTHNPAYRAATDDFGAGADLSIVAVPDLAMPARDLGPPRDLGPRDLAYVPPDLTMGGGMCSAGERGCTANLSASESCSGGSFVVDRTCTGTSHCASGYCTPPTSGIGSLGKRCDSTGGPNEANCMPVLPTDPTCAPYVVPGTDTVQWTCAAPAGMGGPGTACTSGSNCRSGFCGSNGTCFRACQTDCPTLNGTKLRCATVTILVEGVSVSASSCIP